MLHTISVTIILIAVLYTLYQLYLHHTNWARRYGITNQLWYYGPHTTIQEKYEQTI